MREQKRKAKKTISKMTSQQLASLDFYAREMIMLHVDKALESVDEMLLKALRSNNVGEERAKKIIEDFKQNLTKHTGDMEVKSIR